MAEKRAQKTRITHCPLCRASIQWDGNPCRPFCSERCRWLDLSAWIQGRYVVPEESVKSSTQEWETGSSSDFPS